MHKYFIWASHFSGCGGSTIGAMQAGFKPIYAIDNNPFIADIYRKNCGDITVADIIETDATVAPIPSAQERRQKNQVLVLQTSPPCQEYSIANSNKKLTSLNANILRYSYSYYTIFKPEYVILENVPGYAKSKVYQNFKAFLISLGYLINEHKLDAQNFGVPQRRKRLIMIAAIPGYRQPVLTQKKKLGWFSAVKDLIPTLPKSELTNNQKLLIDNYQGDLLIERIAYRDSPKFALPIEPCWTIRACLGDVGRTKYIDAVVSGQALSVNTHVLARLQSFPDTYQWTCNPVIDVRGIGNSVPPLMMQVICESIIEACK